MLTVIFGAGASYDSNPSSPSFNNNDGLATVRPPLARDLFDVRYGDESRKNREALSLFQELRQASPGIEEALEKIRNKADKYPPIHISLLSMRYYLRDVISFATKRWIDSYTDNLTYHSLLHVIDQWQSQTGKRVALVTFNYDPLIEMACKDILGIDFSKIDSYIDNSTPYKIYKVHGSTNWFHKVKGIEGGLMKSAPNLVWTGAICTDQEMKEHEEDEDYLPAIAIPTISKSSFEFPETHKRSMIEDLRQTTDIITIGWRGAEKHFLKLLNDPSIILSNRRLEVVGTDQVKTAEVINKITSNATISYGYKNTSNSGFSEYVPNGLKKFLGLSDDSNSYW